jgi:transketolase
MIICDTRMAKGVPFLEEREMTHFLRVDEGEWDKALEVLDANRQSALHAGRHA